MAMITTEVSSPSKEAIQKAFVAAEKIKKHLSSAEGQRLLKTVVYPLIDDVIAQIRKRGKKPSQKAVVAAVLPTIFRIEDRLGWDMPFMSEEAEDRLLGWLVGRAVNFALTGKLTPSRE